MKKSLVIALAVGAIGIMGYAGLHASTLTQFGYSKESFLSQTGSISNAVLFTPTADGDYQVSLYGGLPQGSCAIGGQSLAMSLTWADNNYTNSYGFEAVQNYGSTLGSPQGNSPLTIHVASGNAVTLTVSDNGSCGSKSAYDVFVTVIGN